MRRPSSDDRSPDRDRFDPSFYQLLDEAKWWARRNHALVLRGWIVDDRAVLSDDEIKIFNSANACVKSGICRPVTSINRRPVALNRFMASTVPALTKP